MADSFPSLPISPGISAGRRTPRQGNKAVERCVISTFHVVESMGFKGDFRQWEHLLRIAADGSLAFSIAAI
jgi:hypothetical protein